MFDYGWEIGSYKGSHISSKMQQVVEANEIDLKIHTQERLLKLKKTKMAHINNYFGLCTYLEPKKR